MADEDPAHLVDLTIVYGTSGRQDAAKRNLERLEAIAQTTFISPLFMALAYEYAGDLDRGFEWLDRMCDERSPGIIGFKIDPSFDKFRSDPRFGRILRRVGFVK